MRKNFQVEQVRDDKKFKREYGLQSSEEAITEQKRCMGGEGSVRERRERGAEKRRAVSYRGQGKIIKGSSIQSTAHVFPPSPSCRIYSEQRHVSRGKRGPREDERRKKSALNWGDKELSGLTQNTRSSGACLASASREPCSRDSCQTYRSEEIVSNFVANELFRHLEQGTVNQKRASHLRLRNDLSNSTEHLRGAGDDRRHSFADTSESRRRGGEQGRSQILAAEATRTRRERREPEKLGGRESGEIWGKGRPKNSYARQRCEQRSEIKFRAQSNPRAWEE